MSNSNITCVIIDDDGVLRSLMASILRNSEINVVGEAATADLGLKLCKELRPKLVFLDINLPERSGLDLMPEIMGECPDTQIVMVSGDAKIDLVRKALTQGAKGFVVKPFTSARLLEAVERSMGVKLQEIS